MDFLKRSKSLHPAEQGLRFQLGDGHFSVAAVLLLLTADMRLLLHLRGGHIGVVGIFCMLAENILFGGHMLSTCPLE
jgi:hypothetical protein